ncbi:hypothetical protein QYF36_001955 [Acer negundo]|nr:hypothetical protein QYF36_001955 [Acer negundo]
MLGKATLHYAHARFKEAKSVLTEVVMLNPCLPDTYHTLGLVYDTIGNAEKAAGETVQLCPENVEALKTGAKLQCSMETNAYDKALQHIEHSHLVYYSDEELPLNLKIRAGICHIHLGNMDIYYLLFIWSAVNL